MLLLISPPASSMLFKLAIQKQPLLLLIRNLNDLQAKCPNSKTTFVTVNPTNTQKLLKKVLYSKTTFVTVNHALQGSAFTIFTHSKTTFVTVNLNKRYLFG